MSKVTSSTASRWALGSFDKMAIRSSALVPATTAISFPFLPEPVRELNNGVKLSSGQAHFINGNSAAHVLGEEQVVFRMRLLFPPLVVAPLFLVVSSGGIYFHPAIMGHHANGIQSILHGVL